MKVDPLTAGADTAEARLEEWSAEAEERAAQARTFADRVSALTTTATDRDSTVQVTVNASGAVTDLRLADRVRSLPAEQIGERILAVMRAAQAQLASRVFDVAVQTVGEQSPIGRDVVSGYETRFPAPPERDPGRQHGR